MWFSYSLCGWFTQFPSSKWNGLDVGDSKWLTLTVPFCVYPDISLYFWIISSGPSSCNTLPPLSCTHLSLSSNFRVILPCISVLEFVSVHYTYSHNLFLNLFILLLFFPHFKSSVILQPTASTPAQDGFIPQVWSIFSTESGSFP